MQKFVSYPAPNGAIKQKDFTVRIRSLDGEWQELFTYQVKVDMHDVRNASMVYFDMQGMVEVEVSFLHEEVRSVKIRPSSYNIPFTQNGNTITFSLDRPLKLSIEVNEDTFHNLHLFANPLEENPPCVDDPNVLLVQPGIHRTEDLLRLLKTTDTIYFEPGAHYLEEAVLRIPSGKTVYLAGGSMLVGSLVCEHVQNVSIRGRGIIYLSGFERFTAMRGVRIVFSSHIDIEGIMTLDPPHYSIYIGQSEQIQIRNFKSFSTRGWSDGIDIMSSRDIEIDDVFLRTSDDCIAIYGSRWDFYGDTRHIHVKNSTLWADVAHPLMMGTHGDHQRNGDVIEDIFFENVDILEHHEPQSNYWGAIAINAGDQNLIRNVTYENIRVEDFELGQLVDVRVFQNAAYCPKPGKKIENILFRNISYSGKNLNPNRIYGYDGERIVDGVTFVNLQINGELITEPKKGNFDINEFTRGISFLKEM